MSCGLVRKEAVSSRSVGAEGPAPWSVVPWAANSTKLNFAVRMGCGACGLIWPSQTVPEEPVPVVNEEKGGGAMVAASPVALYHLVVRFADTGQDSSLRRFRCCRLGVAAVVPALERD